MTFIFDDGADHLVIICSNGAQANRRFMQNVLVESTHGGLAFRDLYSNDRLRRKMQTTVMKELVSEQHGGFAALQTTLLDDEEFVLSMVRRDYRCIQYLGMRYHDAAAVLHLLSQIRKLRILHQGSWDPVRKVPQSTFKTDEEKQSWKRVCGKLRIASAKKREFGQYQWHTRYADELKRVAVRISGRCTCSGGERRHKISPPSILVTT